MIIPIRRGPIEPPPVPDWTPHDKVIAHFNAQNKIDGLVHEMVAVSDLWRCARHGIVPLGGS